MASISMKTLAMLILAMFASCFPLLTSAAALGKPDTQVGAVNHAAALAEPPCCFAKDCLSFSLDSSGRILHGTCYDKLDQRGHWLEVTSSLDLSNCVGNFNGMLVPASAGGYSQSCENCSLQDTILTCKCKGPSGSPGLKATVDLNVFVQDSQGVLKCFNYDGTVISRRNITDGGIM